MLLFWCTVCFYVWAPHRASSRRAYFIRLAKIEISCRLKRRQASWDNNESGIMGGEESHTALGLSKTKNNQPDKQALAVVLCQSASLKPFFPEFRCELCVLFSVLGVLHILLGSTRCTALCTIDVFYSVYSVYCSVNLVYCSVYSVYCSI